MLLQLRNDWLSLLEKEFSCPSNEVPITAHCTVIYCTVINNITFSLSQSTTNEKLMAYAKYSYDALGQRIRFREIGSYVNKTFHLDALLLFREVPNTSSQYKLNKYNTHKH